MTLDQLPLGQSGKVVKLTGSPAVRRRLMEMGITPAAMVEAVRRAPMGDPLDIKIRGYHLSLRREEASAVEIAPAAAPIAGHIPLD
jgi:Fe2+ transport system protein FeoA